jgi:regulator of CtrA degradation
MADMGTHRIRRQVIEELYEETLLLADEARAVFDMRGPDASNADGNPARIALSIEGLRTTTRLMNLLAWLLNQRAFFAGELTEGQVRRHGALAQDRRSDPVQIDRLELATRALVRESERLYARAERLDTQLRSEAEVGPARELQDRLSIAFRGG